MLMKFKFAKFIESEPELVAITKFVSHSLFYLDKNWYKFYSKLTMLINLKKNACWQDFSI
jgi:hypothetical protein